LQATLYRFNQEDKQLKNLSFISNFLYRQNLFIKTFLEVQTKFIHLTPIFAFLIFSKKRSLVLKISFSQDLEKNLLKKKTPNLIF